MCVPFLVFPSGARKDPSASHSLISGCFLFQTVTSAETSPDATVPISTSLESLASMSLSTSPECSSPESENIRMVSYNRKHQKASHKPIQEKKAKPLMFSKSRQLDLNCTSMKNDIKKQYLMSEILQKVQIKKKRPLFPTPKSREYGRGLGCTQSLGTGVSFLLP